MSLNAVSKYFAFFKPNSTDFEADLYHSCWRQTGP